MQNIILATTHMTQLDSSNYNRRQVLWFTCDGQLALCNCRDDIMSSSMMGAMVRLAKWPSKAAA